VASLGERKRGEEVDRRAEEASNTHTNENVGK
jgi:hypothetical protein